MPGPFFTCLIWCCGRHQKTFMGQSALNSRSSIRVPDRFLRKHGMHEKLKPVISTGLKVMVPSAPKHPVRRFAKRESSDGIFARDVCDCRPQGRQSRNSPNVIREGDAAGTLFSWKDNKGNRTRKGVDSLRPQEFVHLPLTLFHFALHCS